MNWQREFIGEIFHALAQPITALRATVELGLAKTPQEEQSRQSLENCLELVDRLMQELALLREMASLDEVPPLSRLDAKSLLQGCVAEMEPVAHASCTELHLTAAPAQVECNEAMFRRAVFVLLDELIASAPHGGKISISLSPLTNGSLLELRPPAPQGQRQKLFHKLMQFAGASSICHSLNRTSITFRDSSNRLMPETPLADKRSLTAH